MRERDILEMISSSALMYVNVSEFRLDYSFWLCKKLKKIICVISLDKNKSQN